MTTDEQEKKILMSADQLARLRAEAAIAEAEARAESVTATAEARAKELIAEAYRRARELYLTHSMASLLTRSAWENIISEQADKHLPSQFDPNLLREAISVRAYYKAAQRGWGPGHEIDDWLDAEREFLAVSPFFEGD